MPSLIFFLSLCFEMTFIYYHELNVTYYQDMSQNATRYIKVFPRVTLIYNFLL